MRAVLADKTVVAAFIAIDDQLLPKDLHRPNRLLVRKLTGGLNRMPITAQQLAARRAPSHLSE
jgi:hypothetical protein